MEDHSKIFKDIYDKNVWGGSGGGSNPANCTKWIAFIKQFIKDNNVKSVVDFGCGDWQHSNLIEYDKLGANYLGIECVQSLVDLNTVLYSNPHIKFVYLSDYKKLTLKKADLLIVKDVLMHWKTKDIVEFLNEQVNNYNHIILSNIIENSDRVDSDVPSVRPVGLSSQFKPLSDYNITSSFIDDTNPKDLKEIIYIKRNA